MEAAFKMNQIEAITNYTESLVKILSARYGFDSVDALTYLREEAALEPEVSAVGRGRPEKKVKKVVNKSEMVEETIAAVLTEVLAEAVTEVVAEVVAEKPKKKVTPKKKAEVVEAEPVAEPVVEEKPKKKAAPKKKAEVEEVVAEPKKKAAKKAEAVAEKPKKAEVVEPVAVSSELEEEEMEVDIEALSKVTYQGVEYYLKMDDQTVYSVESQDYVGTWNAEEESVEFEEEE